MANTANKITKTWVIGDHFLAEDQEGINKGTINKIIDDDNKYHTLMSGNGVNAVIREGNANQANGDKSVNLGEFCYTNGLLSMAIGKTTKAEGEFAFAGGNGDSFFSNYVLADGKNSFNFSNSLGNNITGVYSENGAILGGQNGLLTSAAINSIILGGQNLTGTSANTVYVQKLNILEVNSGTSINNLGIDADGNVVVGSSGGGINDIHVIGGSLTQNNYLSLQLNNSTSLQPINLSALTNIITSVNGEIGDVILTTGDINEDTDKNYVTDVEKTVIGNTSGTNTGDQDISGIADNATDIATLSGDVTSIDGRIKWTQPPHENYIEPLSGINSVHAKQFVITQGQSSPTSITPLGVDANGIILSNINYIGENVTGATNGNTVVNKNVELGGNLFKDVAIDLNDKEFVIKDDIDDLSFNEEGILFYNTDEIDSYSKINLFGAGIDIEVANTATTESSSVKIRSNVVTISELNITNLFTGTTSTKNLGTDANGNVVEFKNKYVETITFVGGTAQTINHNLNDNNVIVQLIYTGQLTTATVDNYLTNSVDVEVTNSGDYKVIIIK